MNCAVLLPLHPCISADIEKNAPLGPPLLPYFWFQILFGISGTSSYAKKTFAWTNNTMDKETDIGKFIIHIGNPANINLPMIIAFSSSKSMFGASKVLIENNVVAIASIVYVSQNYNCNAPVKIPTGYVIAPNTVLAGATLGDYMSGVFSMAFDSAISFGFSKLSTAMGISGRADKIGASISSKISSEYWKAATGRVVGKIVKGLVESELNITGGQKALKDVSKKASEFIGEEIDAKRNENVASAYFSDDPVYGN